MSDLRSPRLLAALLGLLVTALLAIGGGPVQAETGDQPGPDPELADIGNTTYQAPVIVDGNTLFILRGLTAMPAEQRARKVAERIVAVAERPDDGFLNMKVEATEFGLGIYAGDTLIVTVTPAEAQLEQLRADLLAPIYKDRIQSAILDYRAARTEKARISGAIDVLIWTTAFLAFVLAHRYARRRLPTWTSRYIRRHFGSVEEATRELIKGRAIASLVSYVIRIVLIVTFFIALYYYLSLVLLAFAETRPIAQILLTYVTEPILRILNGFIHYLPDLITIVIICFVTFHIVRGLRVFFEAVEAGSISFHEFEPHWALPTYLLVRTVVILIAAVFCFPYIPGSDSAAFQGLTVLVGLMVSLGSSALIGNVMAGLLVIYRRSMNIGDRIHVGNHTGDVVAIKLMETHLRSVKNELVSIPNLQILNSEVVNYTSKFDGRGLLVHTSVGIGYEEHPEKIEAMLLEAAARTEGLKKSPAPFVLWTELGDYAISYEINAYSTRGNNLPRIQSNLHRNIVAVFNANGVQIMTPAYRADPPEPKIPKGKWDGTLVLPDEPGETATK